MEVEKQMSEQEKRCSAYLRTWVKRKRCSYKAVKNGRCRRHQEKNAAASHQPAIEGDVVERVARAIRLEYFRVDSESDNGEEGMTVDLAQNYAKAAIAAMQPAIEQAVAEERARIARFMRTHCIEQSHKGYEIKPVTGRITDASNELWAKAIEQGGGDA